MAVALRVGGQLRRSIGRWWGSHPLRTPAETGCFKGELRDRRCVITLSSWAQAMQELATRPADLLTVSLALTALLMVVLGLVIAGYRLRQARGPEGQAAYYGSARVLAVVVIGSASCSLLALSAAAAQAYGASPWEWIPTVVLYGSLLETVAFTGWLITVIAAQRMFTSLVV